MTHKMVGAPEATLPDAWYFWVKVRTSWPGVNIQRLGEIKSLICSFYLSAAAYMYNSESKQNGPPGYTVYVTGTISNQERKCTMLL